MNTKHILNSLHLLIYDQEISGSEHTWVLSLHIMTHGHSRMVITLYANIITQTGSHLFPQFSTMFHAAHVNNIVYCDSMCH